METEIISIILGIAAFWSGSCTLFLCFLFIGKAQGCQNNHSA